MSRTIVIMAGGTGGHVMPGLAVAQAMRARDWRVVWLGNPTGMEASLVPKHGIEMRWVRFGGLRGKGLRTRLMLPLNLMRACWQALGALRAVKPAVVLGLGGYISFPGGVMASLLRVPLVLHEQNSIAGLANRVLGRLSTRALVAFPDALPGAEWCGNPVRADIAARDLRKKKVGLLSDATQRAKIGQVEDASRTAEYQDVLQQESDLTAGHGVLRYTGLISVSAPTVDELDAAVAAIEQAAVQASCETRRLVGQQASAFAVAALPLCRDV